MCKRKVIVISREEYREMYEEECRVKMWQSIHGPAVSSNDDMSWVQVDNSIATARPSMLIRGLITESRKSYEMVVKQHDQGERWENVRLEMDLFRARVTVVVE